MLQVVGEDSCQIGECRSQLDTEQWQFLRANGYLPVGNIFPADEFAAIAAACAKLLADYPFGFVHSGPDHDPANPRPRDSAPRRDEFTPTTIIPHIGFRDPIFHEIVEHALIYNTIERVLGPDFVLSNSWLQVVPAGLAARMGYHKDPRGSFSFTVLMEDQSWNTGSTCLVPGSHRSTPPAQYAMAAPHRQHPREIHISGKAGDICFFSPEAWHGRAPNLSDRPTLRLVFACYGRRSHDATSWSRAIGPQQLSAAMAALPPIHRHLLTVDPGTNRAERETWSRFRRWFTADGRCSSRLVADFFFGLFGGRANRLRPARDCLPPYTTALSGRFDPIRYLTQIDLHRTAELSLAAALDRHVLGRRLKDRLKRRRQSAIVARGN
jgi:hypothetical protein